MTGVFHICIAMKPLEGNFSKNALKNGVAGLNIDGSRIQTNDKLVHGGSLKTNSGDTRGGKELGMFQDGTSNTYSQSSQGRWPANIILDNSEEIKKEFPNTKSGATGDRCKKSRVQQKAVLTPFTRGQNAPEYTDKGSSARFFKQIDEYEDKQ